MEHSLDFNKGSVTLSETNQYGHLRHFTYRFKAGYKLKTDLQAIANHVVRMVSRNRQRYCGLRI